MPMSVDILARQRALQLCGTSLFLAAIVLSVAPARAADVNVESVVVTGSRLSSTFRHQRR